AVGEQTFDDAVERAGAQADGAAGELLDRLHDGVAVDLAVGERDEHVEHRRGERQQRSRVAFRHMSSDDMALDDIVSRKVYRAPRYASRVTDDLEARVATRLAE